MMRNNKNIYIALFFCALMCALTSCVEEFTGDDVIPKGESQVAMSMEFTPFTQEAVGTRSSGDIHEEIKDLCILVYDKDGNYMSKKFLTKNPVPGGDGYDLVSRGHAEFKMSLPYGRYQIYAVANMGDMSGHDNDIRTVAGLKALTLEWKSDAVADNSQMLGYFTVKGTADKGPELTISEKKMTLHAWLRRAASKVTVSYDASGLEEGVIVYLKSVQVRDIPATCPLGDKNVPVAREDTIANGEKILYYKGAEPKVFDASYEGPRLTKGKPLYGSHASDSDQSMFFYENMQGSGSGMPDKRQDADGNGKLDHPGFPSDATYRKKDGVGYGTYIEVDAFYVSINPAKVGSGKIKYRFMLGKNETTDYDAERNCHYKLTLHLKGYANDADWHIEYTEPEPGLEIPDPYYISYLYNHSMMLPIKVNAGASTLQSVKARIIENDWGPYEAAATDYWNKPGPADSLWNGFLSLHKTTKTVVKNTDADDPKHYNSLSNKKYYESVPKRGEREYVDMTDGSHSTPDTGSLEKDKYSVAVEKDDDGANLYHIQIPMYTRAKQLVKQTAFTGNNPYSAYHRKAKVEISAVLSDKTVLKDTVTILQAHRLVNPKGVWRRHDNDKAFDVTLTRQKSEGAGSFEAFDSEGPWKAYVVKKAGDDYVPDKDNSFISLDGGSEVRDAVVYGATGSDIKFKIKFNGTCGADESRYAVIRVEYHNYSCYHLIFVRQGECPDELVEGGTRWHVFNMKTMTEETSSPTEEGSLFRFGNWTYPIDASNNMTMLDWKVTSPSDFKDESRKSLVIAGSDAGATWSAITPAASATGSFSDPGDTLRVASYGDYLELYRSDDIEQGYGVLYGDKAVTTAYEVEDVFGVSGKADCMRGCFVYNSSTSKNLFFPIGASGYGRRKHDKNISGRICVMQYANRNALFPETFSAGSAYDEGVKGAPLFYDIYKRPGAIYWLDRLNVTQLGDEGGESNAMGWDFNFFTFDFFEISNTIALDACFLRCVDK